MDKIIRLRKEIDIVDDKLLMLLSERLSLCNRIGEEKSRGQLNVLDEDRWMEVLRSRTNSAMELGLDIDKVKELLEVIHNMSIEEQKVVVNSREEL